MKYDVLIIETEDELQALENQQKLVQFQKPNPFLAMFEKQDGTNPS